MGEPYSDFSDSASSAFYNKSYSNFLIANATKFAKPVLDISLALYTFSLKANSTSSNKGRSSRPQVITSVITTGVTTAFYLYFSFSASILSIYFWTKDMNAFFGFFFSLSYLSFSSFIFYYNCYSYFFI